jgi:hypothetical protein
MHACVTPGRDRLLAQTGPLLWGRDDLKEVQTARVKALTTFKVGAFSLVLPASAAPVPQSPPGAQTFVVETILTLAPASAALEATSHPPCTASSSNSAVSQTISTKTAALLLRCKTTVER